MQPRSQRRVYGAEFKARVLAECQRPGASVAAVALAHGLNVNLVRKWLVGRGLKRSGLVAPRAVPRHSQSGELAPAPESATPASLRFLPVELAAARVATSSAACAAIEPSRTEQLIHVELRRGAAQIAVRWPASHAGACAAWLQELAAATLK